MPPSGEPAEVGPQPRSKDRPLRVATDLVPAANQARQTHCKNGHPLSGDNLRITPLGKRHCRECGRIYMKAYYEKNGRKDWRRSGRYASKDEGSLA